MYNALFKVYKSLIYTTRDILYSDYLNVDYSSNLNNFGDILNKYLIEQLTGKKVFEVRSEIYKKEHYLAIGSVLQRANKNSIVWGSGFISAESICKEEPKKICAVRGPLTRNKLLQQNINCPEVYGDPALLMPLLYNPEQIEKKYKYGIVPHYVDKNVKWIGKNANSDEIKILDIQNKNVIDFIKQLLSCEMIISSSLHGIIIADAYNIPSLWVEFSNKVVGKGFKFLDYYSSVNSPVKVPFEVNEDTKFNELENSFVDTQIDFDYKPLLKASPFEIKSEILNKINL